MTTARPFPRAALGFGLGRFNFEDPDLALRVLLTTAAYTPDPDVHEFRSHVTAEVVGAGYTAGGQLVTGLEWGFDTTTDAAVLTCDTVLWDAVTLTCRRAVAYVDTGDPATSALLSWVDFDTDVVLAGTPLPLIFPAGLYRHRTP